VADIQGGGVSAHVTVDMGDVRVTGSANIDVNNVNMLLITADAGNPHAVRWGEYTHADVRELGPLLATHTAFPEGANIEFAKVRDGQIDLVVWERGAGLTLACGTGACAAAVSAWDAGFVPRGPVVINLPGGTLEISQNAAGHVLMRGPARRVFRGSYDDR
jgi:diaminopimelate epimerase